MRKAHVCSPVLLLICLCVLAPVAYSQPPGDEKQRRPASGLFQVSMRDEKSGKKKIGFINRTGKLVIGFDRLPGTTAIVGEFHEGRAVIYLEKKRVDRLKRSPHYNEGYIDETGNVVIAPRFSFARDFSEGLAYVEAEEFRGFIDRQGKVVIKLDADEVRVGDFHEGLAAVSTRGMGGGWGYIDRSGRLVIEGRYQLADDFSEGLAQVMVDRNLGFINKKGEVVIQPRFDARVVGYVWEGKFDTSRFSEGLACVSVGSLYGYIDKKGVFVIPPQFRFAQEFSEGLAWVVTGDEKTRAREKAGWIDKSGRWVVSGVDGRSFSAGLPEFFSYTNILRDWRYSEGLVPFVVYDGDRTLRGYMNQRGESVIQPGEFNEVGPFVGGLARVQVSGISAEAYGYIDRTGKFIWRSK